MLLQVWNGLEENFMVQRLIDKTNIQYFSQVKWEESNFKGGRGLIGSGGKNEANQSNFGKCYFDQKL